MANENQGGQDLNQILRLRREKLAEMQEAGKDPYTVTKFDVTAHSTDITKHFDEMEGQTVSVAGRLMTKRVMGKALSLIHI